MWQHHQLDAVSWRLDVRQAHFYGTHGSQQDGIDIFVDITNGATNMKGLTLRQEEALGAIARFWKEGRAPTTGELLRDLGLATESGLTDLLRPLRDKGFVSVVGGVRGRQRLIELTSKGRGQTGFGVPVLGEIPAGAWREAIQNSGEWLDGIGALLHWDENDFLLRVSGDSMSGAGILPGDYIQLRAGVRVSSGEIVAAQIDDGRGHIEATLKYLDFDEGAPTMRLRAANPAYPTREVDAVRVSVAGVFRGLVRVGS